MKITRDATTLHVGESFRIEPGPRRVTATATEALLDNSQTAPHYALEVNDTPDGEPPRPGVDADGKLIELGKPIAYLDWTGVEQGREGALVFYLYGLQPMTPQEVKDRSTLDGEPPQDCTIWREVGTFETEEEALGAALSHEGE